MTKIQKLTPSLGMYTVLVLFFFPFPEGRGFRRRSVGVLSAGAGAGGPPGGVVVRVLVFLGSGTVGRRLLDKVN